MSIAYSPRWVPATGSIAFEAELGTSTECCIIANDALAYLTYHELQELGEQDALEAFAEHRNQIISTARLVWSRTQASPVILDRRLFA